MNPSNFTPTEPPVKWPVTRYTYSLDRETLENFSAIFDAWWHRRQADHTGFQRWVTPGAYVFQRGGATPSLFVRLSGGIGALLSVTIEHVTVERPFWADGDLTNHGWAKADLGAVGPTVALCAAVRTWIESTYTATAQVESEPGTQPPEEQPPKPTRQSEPEPEPEPAVAVQPDPQPEPAPPQRKQPGPELDQANRWLIEQFFDVYQEKKKLPYFRDQWLRLRSADGKSEPGNTADSMRQVIADERRRRKSMNRS